MDCGPSHRPAAAVLCSASKVSSDSESWQRKRFPASGQLAQLSTLRLVDADDGRSGSRFQGPNIYLEGVGCPASGHTAHIAGAKVTITTLNATPPYLQYLQSGATSRLPAGFQAINIHC